MRRLTGFSIVIVAALFLYGCGGDSEPASNAAEPPAGAISDLQNVLELRAAFNDDQGKPRLVLLLSPT